MPLSAGTRLGPYEILAPLGAGGMGEVYRARDSRLGREVAVKVLPASLSNDGDRLRRFEQEARAAGLLNHPNITAVYDIGTNADDGAPYVVSELLEGETLRGRISGGAVPVRKAIDWALQIAHGLAAAHGKGIVHRDLKPENLFVTKDGRVKILDFGLAKLTQSEDVALQTDLPTAAAATEPGVVLGTLGYMSPEQVKGMGTDARSDIFAFGTILYEMLSGTRAFHRGTAAETMVAILREEPPDLSATNQSSSPGLERIVRHCLEKNPEERFHSAHDLAFDLEALSEVSAPRAGIAVAAPAASRRRRLALSLASAAALLAAGAGLYLAGKKAGHNPPPSYKQLTFRRGTIRSARFAPDGKTVLYSAEWDGLPAEIYLNSAGSPESRPLGLPDAELLAVSSSGEAAVSLRSTRAGGFTRTGTLARTSVTGAGAPREVLEGVQFADWSPDGRELAIVRTVAGQTRLEFPIGKVLYENTGWIGDPRVSPQGDRVAFVDHQFGNDDGGSVVIVDRAGKKTVASPVFATARGLAWSPDGSEVWFSAAETGSNRALYAVQPARPSARPRLLARVTGSLRLQDVSRDGRVLLTRDAERLGFFASVPGQTAERDLSWLDYGQAVEISADGSTVLFFESGEGGGTGYSTYLRKTDGSPALRLGEGTAQGLSPDGKWVLAIVHQTTDPQLVLYPTGAGEARVLSPEGLKVRQARWLPDGRRILVAALEEGHAIRIYVRDVEGGKPRPVTPERYRFLPAVSPDGKRFVTRGPDDRFFVFPVAGGEPVPVPGLAPGDYPVGWTADSEVLYVRRAAAVPARVVRLDIKTGRAEPWREFAPADTAGLVNVGFRSITPDGRFYVYNCSRMLSDLFLVEGLQ